MRRCLLFLTILQFALCSCPSGFTLVRDGECRGNYTTVAARGDQLTNAVISKCSELQGQPMIIHNEEHQSYWRERVVSEWTSIGLVCNTNTKLWEWADGSAVDFKPPPGFYRAELDAMCTQGLSWVLRADGDWGHWNGQESGISTDVFCTTQLQQPYGDGCDSFDDDSDDGVCYEVDTNAENWQDAQTKCRSLGANVASIHNLQENSFIRRLAVSKGAVNGVFIGASASGKGNEFGWVDGSAWDYDNFYPGFPVEGHGFCLAMDTFGGTGEWMNMDCSSKLAVACERPANPRHTCSSGPWKEGDLIYSPGYPYDASIPCDYFLSVAAGKRVQVEILVLEANSCCDHLLLSDDVLGGNIVANLTGEIADKMYTTQSSNFMRVSWLPNKGVNVRGMMMTFRGVF